MIQGPRWNNHQTRCGYFWNPDQFDRIFCIFGYLPGPPPLGDHRPPSLRVRVLRRQRVLALRRVIVYARCDEACAVNVTGRLTVGRRSLKLRAAGKRAAAGKRVLVRVGLPSAAARGLRRALRRHKRATIGLGAQARDATGNRSDLTRRTVMPR